ncbi:MAG: immunity 42 family protein [Ruminococcus sp.]|uniref:immunity 42 family protein n=1 Tax=Ruminococcus sp. TaxID=41978 RepID=UPI0025EBBBA0|nr:immunity 42 family protein [Ruminococcus sp.]MBO4866232.1 immunity 42 family protein [Ruminococcus sp.]
MFIGDVKYPCNFGFMVEYMPEWSDSSFKNGLMFMMMNDELYPKNVRTTTFNSELPDVLADNSAMKNPVVDKKLYHTESEKLFEIMADKTYGKERDAWYDGTFQIPFHEINDDRWSVFIISDGDHIKLMSGEWRDGDIHFHDELEIPSKKYFETIKALEEFYNTLSSGNGGHENEHQENTERTDT